MQLRRASPSDAAAIAGVHVRSWQVAYRGIVPDEVLDAMSIPERESRWQAILAHDAEGAFTLVAEHGGRVVGFCSLTARSRDAGTDARTGEIAAIYVDPAHWRLGAGRALLAEALRELRAAGCDAATLWVFARNDGALAFYRGFDFVPDGAEAVEESSGETEIRLRAPLDP